jgi:IS30 family transposase
VSFFFVFFARDKRWVSSFLIIGKGHSGAVVTIVERATQFSLVANVPNKSAEAVTAATIELLKPYKGALHTITADNGKEFAYHEQLSTELGAAVYFARPYHSWERGLNENTNGLLRQYWPKSTDFKKVTKKEVDRVVRQLNQRPRKTLGFETPENLMQNHMAAIAA